ncbi:glycosyltransferase family 1 protein [Cyanobium sp. WAJ14-Wanaka]|uniref:glycosyltransferase family 4 protein n=1 Tax=Cyanobium sp. WAJ14-Wanaka TaxID=2823725 RepID=UPI0020CF769A|nr:glycosyltransferase family 1 protein [Cyanobium sp. WAJ14-Wanaka]MCP9775698.1 glycosyltransferase family 4 protein [Cyanobium sp. WAJ14-Wanaka]
MTRLPLLFNLLPYRPEPTGLSRYVERLLAAWPGESLPWQLRLAPPGHGQFSQSPHLPTKPCTGPMGLLQRYALAQHALPLRRLLADHWPDRIYSPYSEWLWALPQVPQVITCHDLTPLHFPSSCRAHWRSRLLLPAHFERAALVVAISQSVANQLVQTGLPARRIAVVPNGVEPVADPIQAPASHDCVVLARHARNKNLALALNGFAALLKRNPDWPGRLLVVGATDRCTSALFRQQRQLGLGERVRWISPLPPEPLETLLRQAFCLVSPSLMEGFDYPLLEAQALGLPTLASRIPVHQELHQDAALLFELHDRGDTMAHQLQRLDRDPALWRQLSQAGLLNAAAHTSQRQAREINSLLRDPLP